jgi:hypothetical protein
MIRALLIPGIFLLIVTTFGCGGTADSNNANSNVVVTNLNPVNNANVQAIVPINAPIANPKLNNANQTNAPSIDSAKARPLTYPAPDDSEYQSTMDSSGAAIETRTFHKDPFINKVERVWKGVNDKTISIYLKSGKVVKLSGDKWQDIKSQPVQVFYDAAGIRPQTPSANGQTRSDQKTKTSVKP